MAQELPAEYRAISKGALGEWNQALLMWPVWLLISPIIPQLHNTLSQHRIWVTVEWSSGCPLYLISSSHWFSSPPFPTSSSDHQHQGAGLENHSHIIGALHPPTHPEVNINPEQPEVWVWESLCRWVRSRLDNQPLGCLLHSCWSPLLL